MAATFGDLIDATGTARRDTPLVVFDASGATFTVGDVRVVVDAEGAVSSVTLTVEPPAE